MLVNKGWLGDTADDIIYEFETLLCEHNMKINNENIKENQFKSEEDWINEKDCNELKEKIMKQLQDFADSVEDDIRAA